MAQESSSNNKAARRFVCIHGHFYQPPRENPWLDAVERQDSAHPYHDWNQRIHKECYAANIKSPIKDSTKKVRRLNNYEQISFDFGPTLLAWLERYEKKTYLAILEADTKSRENFSGHGLATAQCYSHMIMPLANKRDKQTQVIWGIRDFEYRFRRKPEGMWLPETALDMETLDILAREGITFTILAPHQANIVKKLSTRKWHKIKNGQIDCRRPYICRLPSKKSIIIFFYDGPISHDIAFGDLLNDGVNFANRLVSLFADYKNQPQLASIATDGETFGHHHKFGNMALSYCLEHIKKNNLATITNFAEYAKKFPPTHEVQIIENSSWSCSHGVERWRAHCGCHSGVHSQWNQKWRTPLREAMDFLQGKLSRIFERQTHGLIKDPWVLRDDFINCLLNGSVKNVNQFFSRHSKKSLSENEKIKILKLLEMQRYAMFMYTSCGWFFDDISGIEPIQNLQYAARAMQLANEVSRVSLEKQFLGLLAKARSNTAELKNGARIYRMFVKPAMFTASSIENKFQIQD